MKAQYPGRCGACALPITAGEVIERRDQQGPWLHADCAAAPAELDLGVPAAAPTARRAAGARQTIRARPTDMAAPPGAREVFTDGACSGNPGAGGWAWALSESEHDSGAEPATTNQRMEVRAALEAVRALEGPLVVVSDSTYVVNCFRDGWWRGWLARGWTNSQKQPVANRDLWEPFVELVTSRGDVAFRWVKGHSGDPMNDLVDRLAVVRREQVVAGG